jgi:hypothetical protein
MEQTAGIVGPEFADFRCLLNLVWSEKMVTITDAELMAFMDGVASAETASLIESTPEYMARVQELKRLQAGMRARLYRADCPDPLALGEYQQGLLRGEQALLIHAHLAKCPLCQKEISQLAEFLTPRPGLLERARVVVSQLISNNQPGRLAPAAGLRGKGEAPRIYAAGEVQIVLNVQVDVRRPERKVLAGLVMGLSAAGGEVHLLRGGENVAYKVIDDLGNFVFPDLAPGEYELRLYSPEDEIQVPAFRVE